MFQASTSLVLSRGIARGIRTLKREHRWKSALGALFGIFLLLQILVVVLLGLEGLQSMLKSKTDLRIELEPTATTEDVQLFVSELQSLSYVADTKYITREQAYEQARLANPELVTFLEEFNFNNPFNDTISVTLASLDDYRSFASFTEETRWQNIINPAFLSSMTDQEKRVEELLRLTQAGRSLTAIILGITALSLIFITMELARSRALNRSDEVLVERLTGATPLAILTPFVTETILLFAIAFLLSIACIGGLLFSLPMLIPALQMDGVMNELLLSTTPLLFSLLPLLLGIELIAIPIIAILGVWLGIRPQVRSPRITFAV